MGYNPSITSQACSAAVNVLNGEPTTLTAGPRNHSTPPREAGASSPHAPVRRFRPPRPVRCPSVTQGSTRPARNAVGAVKTEADRYAANVLPIIREAQKAGARTLREIAEALNARGIVTARGGQWYAQSVANILEKRVPFRPDLRLYVPRPSPVFKIPQSSFEISTAKSMEPRARLSGQHWFHWAPRVREYCQQ
jgi:hypothetical protein